MSWTLSELVAEVAARISALPAPRNGQVRAVPDDRTIRYYAAIGLLDRPSAMRGRTALYGRKHLAQVVAIKRLQTMGRSLSEIQAVWPTLDDRTLARMSGIELAAKAPPPGRAAFWKQDRGAPTIAEPEAETPPDEPEPETPPGELPAADAAAPAEPSSVVAPAVAPAVAPSVVELRIELAPNVVLSLSVVDDSVALSPADVRAVRAAAAPLLAELATRRLASHPGGHEP
jgi:DNA-binding transcriptional MerR regulator